MTPESSCLGGRFDGRITKGAAEGDRLSRHARR